MLKLFNNPYRSNDIFLRPFNSTGGHYLIYVYHLLSYEHTCYITGSLSEPPKVQPLPIPSMIWTNISIDFNVRLPKYGNKYAIMLTVFYLFKYPHLCALQHTFNTFMVARVFIDNIFKL